MQESLGGNARTTIVICCSPASFNESETKSTLEFGKRAKTVKNVVCVNEELTAEEWKRRYEREKEKSARLKGKLEKLEQELARWRAGEKVSADEQVNFQDIMEASTSNLETAEADTTATTLAKPTAPIMEGSISNEERARLEAERERLYQQLDDKVYNEAAKSIVTDVLAGYNGTIFAYGQTSSGKTHTMEGVIGMFSFISISQSDDICWYYIFTH